MRARRYRRYTPEQREEAVRLVQVSGQTIAGVARDLGISEKTLWHWVQRQEAGGGEEGKEPLTGEDREELVRLRRENRRLRMEREFLKKRQPSSPRKESAIRDDPGGEGELSGKHDV